MTCIKRILFDMKLTPDFFVCYVYYYVSLFYTSKASIMKKAEFYIISP